MIFGWNALIRSLSRTRERTMIAPSIAVGAGDSLAAAEGSSGVAAIDALTTAVAEMIAALGSASADSARHRAVCETIVHFS